MLIDLGPYIDDGVLSVAPNTALGRVHRLFVSCGMRHLVVTDKDNEVSGIITRKDLTMQRKPLRSRKSGRSCPPPWRAR